MHAKNKKIFLKKTKLFSNNLLLFETPLRASKAVMNPRTLHDELIFLKFEEHIFFKWRLLVFMRRNN
jgi:hypothetical protein